MSSSAQLVPHTSRLQSIARATIRARLDNIRQTRRVLAPYIRPLKPKTDALENKQFQYYLEKKPSILLQIITKWKIAVDLKEILEETIKTLKYATNSTDGIIYLMDDNMEEIFHMTADTELEGDMKVSYKVELDTTVAAYVAYTKRCLKIDDLLEDTRFPQGLGVQDAVVKSVICVPVITSEREVLAVFLMYRRLEYDEYTDDDFYLIIMMATWVGSTIHQHQTQFAMKKHEELNSYLFNLILVYLYDTSVFNLLVADILNIAMACIDADHSVLYIIHKYTVSTEEEEGKVTAYVYEQEDYTDKVALKHKITIPLDEAGILQDIIVNKKMVSLKQCLTDHPDVNYMTLYHRKHYKVKTVLATPIMLSNECFGILMATNKKRVPMFLKPDEKFLYTLAEYAGLAIKYYETYTEQADFKNMDKSYKNTLSYSIQPCIHDQQYYADLDDNFALPPRFHFFDFYLPEDNDSIFPQLISYMLEYTIDDLFKTSEEMMLFILTVRKYYKPNPFHNFHYAFHALHCVHTVLTNTSLPFTQIQIQGMVLAAFCHAMSHPGKSNTMLQTEGHYMHEMHDFPAIEHDNYNVFEFVVKTMKLFTHLNTEEYKSLMSYVKFCILATNLSLHFKRRVQITQICEENLFNFNRESHQMHLISLIMTMCSLSYCCKPFVAVNHSVNQLFKEQYEEGDYYKSIGLCPLISFDRDKADFISEDQIDFMNVVVIPCALLLYKLMPSMNPLYTEAKVVNQHWVEIHESKGQRMWTVAESLPYKFDLDLSEDHIVIPLTN